MTAFYLSSPFKDPSPLQLQPELLGLRTPRVWRGHNSTLTHAEDEAGGWGRAGSGWEWGGPSGGPQPAPLRPAPQGATLQAAFPRTGSMPASYLEPSQLAWEEVGDITVPRSAAGDQRLRLKQGPGKTEPRLVSTTLGHAEKHLLSLDTLPDSRPHPALTGSGLHTWAGTDPEARNCPQGWQEQITKGAKPRSHQGPRAAACWPAPAPPNRPAAKRVGLRGWCLPTRQRTSENPASRRGSGQNWS